ncbi:MAG: PEP-CTERM sorting domain-containing protein [Pacificimonas sp.]
MKTLLLAATSVALIAAPSAAGFIVTPGTMNSVPASNDFQADLAALGLTEYASAGSTIVLDQAGTITFEYFGSESAFRDTFTYGGESFTENNQSTFGPTAMFSVGVPAGAFSGFFTSSGTSRTYNVGDEEFGIFMGDSQGSAFESDVIWIGLDDQISRADDNHDDFILRATFSSGPLQQVPAPGVLGLLGLGALALGGLRRRK